MDERTGEAVARPAASEWKSGRHPKNKDERTAKPLRVPAGRAASTPAIQKKG